MSYKLSDSGDRASFFTWISSLGIHWQENPTPYEIIRKMVSKTSLNDKHILVLFNIEFLHILIDEHGVNPQDITFIADNHIEKLSANKIFKVQSYCVNHKYDKKGNPIYDVKDLYDIIKGLNMKFDLVFSNPPYNGNLDIKILNEIIDVAEELIIVHPSMWLVENKNTLPDFVKFKKKSFGKIKSAEIFNGNGTFGIKLEKPTGIIHFANSKQIEIKNHFTDETYFANDHNEVSIHGSKWIDLCLPFVSSIKDYCSTNGSVWDNIVKSVDDISSAKFYCQTKMKMSAWCVSQINSYKTRMFTFIDDECRVINKSTQRDTNRIPNNPTFEFNTDLEKENFIKYCKTDFARFCLSLYKINENLVWGEMSLIPWLDFTEEWNDERLFKKFNVSKELKGYIRDFLPDYYGIRK
jgi:hypothetical protein